jgi:hypothetical protein
MKTILACVAAAFIAAGATAGAASLISGSQIKTGTITAHNIHSGTITARTIHNGTITSGKLSSGVRRLLNRVTAQSGGTTTVGTPGAAGPNGPNGANGATGASGTNGAKGDTGTNGANGSNGSNGADGSNGFNPATAVQASGDAGWTVGGTGNGGAGVNAATNTASFKSGALHTPGGFDSSTFGGAIGAVHAYSSIPLSQLSSLSYDYVVDHLAAGDSDSASVHITILGAVQSLPANCTTACATQGDSKFFSGFTNLVYTPLLNGIGSLHNASVDVAHGGLLWSTGNLSNGSGTQAQPISLAAFAARNPGAVVTQISFDNGGTSGGGTSASSDTDFSIDNAVVGFGSTFTRYDFGG